MSYTNSRLNHLNPCGSGLARDEAITSDSDAG
jgi:hypothetical protein